MTDYPNLRALGKFYERHPVSAADPRMVKDQVILARALLAHMDLARVSGIRMNAETSEDDDRADELQEGSEARLAALEAEANP